MLELIAMWGGVAGCALAIVAIVAILVVNANIKHTLNRDNILFDQNFALKKQAIELAMSLIDELETSGDVVVHSPGFANRAKNCYNQLLCVCSKMTLAEEFFNLAVLGTNITPVSLAQFKINCRKDIGLSTKKTQLIKRASNGTTSQSSSTFRETIRPDSFTQPPVREQQSFAQPQPSMRPMPQRPVQPQQRVNQPMQNPVRPNSNPTFRRPDNQ